ncbi:tRNA synthetases class I, catalytic domain-containing protein [Mycena polygramma]|nr:tRNA synthetases class I, catalytic domain-containing protein [Mycena polygramma]
MTRISIKTSMDPSTKLFLLDLGFASSKVESVARTKDALARLMDMIRTNGIEDGNLTSHQTSLLAVLAMNTGDLADEKRSYILRYIIGDKIVSQAQLTEAIDYLRRHGDPSDEPAFCAAAGIGIHLTREDIRASVKRNLEGHANIEWNDLRTVLATLKLAPELRWADPSILKEETETAFAGLLGPRPGQLTPKAKAKPQAKSDTITSPPGNIFEEGFLASLHKPGENPQLDDKLRVDHLKATGGKVVTRFPPEPNGFLHIGHAKAIAVNFGYAQYHGGVCYLRYDDTNPSKEEQLYFDNILTAIRWLGIEPDRVTYSSDYFDTLFEKAVELIMKDKAYVCQCTYEEREQGRGAKGAEPREECAHRRRPVDESLGMFEQMKQGHPDLVKATLRMKQDLTDPNPQMWDLVAYRSHSHPHARTGTTWKIYPTYDFAHCLVDSIENISHSLCTSEFVASRQSYEWLCHALEVYTPRQYEYGRLNLTHTVMSKRRLHSLIAEGRVSGWDDIKLPTLIALRRRGVPPEAIMNFVRGLGITTAMATTEVAKFDEFIRHSLEPITPRLFLILRPVKVIIDNLPHDFLLMLEKPYHPKNPDMGTGNVPFTRVIYIDSEDFRVSGSKDYLRLIPGGSVGLLHVPHSITCTSFQTDDAGNVHTIIAHYNDAEPATKPKAFIHWVAECPEHQSPIRVNQVRLVRPLFQSSSPTDGEEIDEGSLEVLSGSLLEVGFWEVARDLLRASRETARARISATKTPAGIPPISEEQLVGPECVRFQATRVGYFSLDSDSDVSGLGLSADPDVDGPSQVIVLNRIVSLKDGNAKLPKQ